MEASGLAERDLDSIGVRGLSEVDSLAVEGYLELASDAVAFAEATFAAGSEAWLAGSGSLEDGEQST